MSSAVLLGTLVASADATDADDAPVGRRIRWPWKILRRTGLAAVPVGARDDGGRDVMTLMRTENVRGVNRINTVVSYVEILVA